ncbi:type 1 glutamine amidotransferase [Secundilactobacillus kimchicus]|nr:type 1 glutamine amidotransferase [Secundilactobacillus kimchicus]MBT9672590.1 type 1 glutamine amidotransferase [Secundilactobacillus kimchicus]
MRISVLQHTPNEGPGMIQKWSQAHGYDMTIYHPYYSGQLPQASDVDLLVILGGPMSPNDSLPWITAERTLIATLLERHTPIFGACFGAQQIAKTLGYAVTKAPAKEVGWAPVYRQSDVISGLPETVMALHWHEEMFEVPAAATLLFSSEHVRPQGFVMDHRVVGLQFHIEPLADNVREMVANDAAYVTGSVLDQSPADILHRPVPTANEAVTYRLLDYICEGSRQP